MKKVFIITGEYSGDIHASHVVKALKQINPDVEIEGVGGENLKNAGVKLFSDQKKMGAVGLSLKIITDHFLLGKRIVDYLTKEYRPDLVLLIDYGVFNLNISKFLKRAGIKTLYYIPPQVWASRKWRINTIKKNIDEVLCIFPFEKTMYESYGIKTHYCGHPFELKFLMKVFVKTAQNLQKNHPDLQFCISHAPNLSDSVYDKYLQKTDFPVIKGENQALLSVSDALILASGTVALEACLYQTPMIIAYRGPWLFYLIYLIVRCIKRVSLPNIIADKLIVPEIIQGDVNVSKISYEIEKLLYDNDYRRQNIKDLGDVKALLSDKISSVEVAKVIDSSLRA